MYMNKSKRNLILAAAIVNLIGITASLIFSMIYLFLDDMIWETYYWLYLIFYSILAYRVGNGIIFSIIFFILGLVASILLIYSIRKKGKYFRRSQGLFLTGFIIIIFAGSFICWLLLFISLFIPDVVVMNTKREVRHEERFEQKEEIKNDQAFEEKKRKIEELKRMRDRGEITEEEYKQRLFDLL